MSRGSAAVGTESPAIGPPPVSARLAQRVRRAPCSIIESRVAALLEEMSDLTTFATARTKKEWWVQAEALVSMLEMDKLTGKSEYYDAFAQTLDFVEKYQVANEGSWWATRKADDSASGSSRARCGRAPITTAARCSLRDTARRIGNEGEIGADCVATTEQPTGGRK